MLEDTIMIKEKIIWFLQLENLWVGGQLTWSPCTTGNCATQLCEMRGFQNNRH
jgi:hypothetical protein